MLLFCSRLLSVKKCVSEEVFLAGFLCLFSSSASLLNTTECISPKTRRWPEDIAWHPSGNSLVATYTDDSGDSQIAIIDLNNKHEV